MTKKAPALHAELQKQLQAASGGGGGGGGGGARAGGGGRAAAASSSSDLWWDVAGWVALSAIVVGVVALARSAPTPAAK